MMTRMNIKGESKSRGLADAIQGLISMNQLRRDDPILSENQLATKFGLSRVTVRQAIAYLVEEGVLYKVKGKGTFVADPTRITRASAIEGIRSKTIALVSPCISNSYNANIARGIEDVATSQGCHVLFRSTDGLVSNEKRALNDLIRAGVAGVILAPSESNPFPPYLLELCGKFRDIVIINEPVVGVDVDVVSSNDLDGGYAATRHLLESGHARITHLRGPRNVANAQAREDGYRKALTEFGLSIDERLIRGERTFGMEEGYENMKKILELPRNERPTAVFAASDHLAWGAYEMAEELGLRVPEDLAIVGYGDLADSARRGLRLTSVRQNGCEIGREACDILLNRGGAHPGEIRRSQKVLISPELIIRDSSGAKHDMKTRSANEREDRSESISIETEIPA